MQGVLRFLQFRNNQKELATFFGNCLLWSANVLVTFLEKYCTCSLLKNTILFSIEEKKS